MKIAASIQVRMGSERLPGKVMADLSGKPMLWHLINRLRQSKYLDEIGVATTVNKDDDIIEEFCQTEDIMCFRGSEKDVLSRAIGSYQLLNASIGVMVYGDNPLIDPLVVDEFIKVFRDSPQYDWVGNDLRTTFPPGMDVEVFSVSSLEDSALRTSDPQLREHPTLFIRKNSEIYRLKNIEAEGSRRRPELYLGVDVPQDLIVIGSVIKHFQNQYSYTLEDIIRFFEKNPDLAMLNKQISRRWKQFRDDN